MNRIFRMALLNIFRIPGLYSKLCHYAKHTHKYPEQEKWDHIHKIFTHAIAAGNVDLVVTGLEHLPEKDGFMFYANHQGMFDVVALAATCTRPLGCVLKKELKDAPLLKQVIACTNSFPMDRADVRQSLTVINAVIQEVKNGRNYLIFPEGTRSKNGNTMGEFHGGSFRCAVKAQCPIVPIAFVDSFKVLDQKGSKKMQVQIHYLPAIAYEEFAHMTATEVAALVKGRIQEKIDQCLAERM
ncbi:MAG: 1-acyl-sn-glycerol-3-phosphate acyltransferase [Oscillospiraceae bacterium]|nr:1-acyl-sn-glycerol-3-phosphate acyltransferase [Oscillospiraceae bacterium]